MGSAMNIFVKPLLDSPEYKALSPVVQKQTFQKFLAFGRAYGQGIYLAKHPVEGRKYLKEMISPQNRELLESLPGFDLDKHLGIGLEPIPEPTRATTPSAGN